MEAVSERQLTSWLHEFDLNGCIELRGFLPRELVESMQREFMHLFEGMRPDISPGQGMRDVGRYRLTLPSLLGKVYPALFEERVRNSPVVASLADRILGKSYVAKTAVETTELGSRFQLWHQDSASRDASHDPSLPKRTTRLAFVVPLVDVTAENGPTEIIPGSHHLWGPNCDAWVQTVPHQAVPLYSQLGDCFLRDGDVFHRGTPNRTTNIRPIYNMIFKQEVTGR